MSAMKWMAVAAVVTVAVQAMGGDTVLSSQKDKVSYSIGVDLGKSFKHQGLDVDPDVLAKGMKDAAAGQKLLMTDDEMRSTMMSTQEEIMKKRETADASAGADNKKKGEEFLADNKKKEGVTTLPSGMQYKVLKAGDGKKPASTDTVECHYKGTLINGTEFDSSYKRGQPATFPVNGVIRGWQEALPLMAVGSKWQLFIPSDLAYGPRGAGGDIGPNETLIFEVELLGIK
jgi:FKBP-type peptidyl-prolyl cis-trans isomerase